MEKARSHQSVDWYHYFKSIREECPWSYSAFIHNKIEIVEYQKTQKPLGSLEARIYILDLPDEEVERLCSELDHGEDEWLFSYPGYGEFATPVPVLIQQNRKRLNDLREKMNASSSS